MAAVFCAFSNVPKASNIGSLLAGVILGCPMVVEMMPAVFTLPCANAFKRLAIAFVTRAVPNAIGDTSVMIWFGNRSKGRREVS